MKEILIINLTRMGDLLQTTPLMAGLKEMHHGSRITLLVNSAFTEICRGIPLFDDLIVFDMMEYRRRLVEKKHSLVENYRFLEDLISHINSREYDLTINITHSPVSAILTSFIRTREIRGFTIDSEGHRVIKHPWMRYFFNVIPNRIYNPFHIVDMYLKIGGVRPEINGLLYAAQDDDKKRASLMLETKGIREGNMLIGFHLGASKGEKTWPVTSYAELADMITGYYGATILLFGSAGETDLAEEFEMHAISKPVNYVGKTNIGELASLVQKCRLFISNDTGPLHIATSAGTKVIDISTANVHFMETGPYGEGHYVLQADLPCVPCGFDVQCNNRICKSLIKPEHVFAVVKEALEGGGKLSLSDSSAWKDVQVYRAHFRDDGYLGFKPLVRHPLRKEILYRILYRGVWNMDPAPLNGNTRRLYENICREISDYGQASDLNEMMLSIRDEMNTMANLVRLSEEGAKYIRLIAEETAKDDMNIDNIKDLWSHVGPIESEIDLIGHTHPCFRPLILIYLYEKEALEGHDLRILSEASCTIYADLMTRSKNMLEMMKTIVPMLEDISQGNTIEMTAQ